MRIHAPSVCLRSAARSPFRREGFTIVEVLVVIAVIVVLVGLTTPAISRIQGEARSTQCVSNLRQIHSAVETYRSMHRSLLPNVEPLPAVTPNGPIGGLPLGLTNFISHESPVWRCPEDFDPESFETGTSYLYLPGLYVLTPEIQFQLPPNVLELSPAVRRELEARLVTIFYEGRAGESIPILLDSQDRHFVGDRVPRNGLFIDGSARPLSRGMAQSPDG